MKCGTDIRVPLWMICNHFGDLFTVFIVSLSGQNAILFHPVLCAQIRDVPVRFF